MWPLRLPLYEVTGGLNTGLAEILANGQSAAIYDVCVKTMGKVAWPWLCWA